MDDAGEVLRSAAVAADAEAKTLPSRVENASASPHAVVAVVAVVASIE